MWMSNVSIGSMGMPMTRMAVSSFLLMCMGMLVAVAVSVSLPNQDRVLLCTC